MCELRRILQVDIRRDIVSGVMSELCHFLCTYYIKNLVGITI